MRIITMLLFILATSSLSAQTLEDYLKMAVAQNPGISAKQIGYQAALQKIPQAKALPEPTVNASFFLRPMMLPMGNQLGSISAMQMFPWMGALDAMGKEAAQMAAAKGQELLVAQNELFFKVKNAWYPLLELALQIQIQQENLRILETDRELAISKFQYGQAPMTDAIRAEIMIDELKTDIALLEQKRKPLEVAFNRLLDRDPLASVLIAGKLPEPVPGAESRRDSFVANNPTLAVFDKQIEAAIAEEKVADFMRKPMFGAGLQYMPLVKRKGGDINIPPNTGKDMWMPMVSVTIPVWRKKYNAAAEERRLMQDMYAEMKQDMQNDLAAKYEMTFYEQEEMAQMVVLLQSQMQKTQTIIDLMMTSYSNAGKDFDEILRLQQQLFQYRLKKVSAQTAYQLARVKLEYLTGNTN